MDAIAILKTKYPDDIAENIVKSYLEVEQNFATEKWKASELDAGHFVESVRRLIELQTTGTYTSFSAKISDFNNNVLDQYERANTCDDAFRFHIPRILKAIYGIRSKRGVGHIANINPNKMDSTLILYNCKWVLAELIRLTSGLSIVETQKIVDDIVNRQIEIIWQDGSITRILKPGMRSRDQILILLFRDDLQQDTDLQKIIEYKNATDFRAILKTLHKQRFIEYKDGVCHLSPLGEIEAEGIIKTITIKEKMI